MQTTIQSSSRWEMLERWYGSVLRNVLKLYYDDKDRRLFGKLLHVDDRETVQRIYVSERWRDDFMFKTQAFHIDLKVFDDLRKRNLVAIFIRYHSASGEIFWFCASMQVWISRGFLHQGTHSQEWGLKKSEMVEVKP